MSQRMKPKAPEGRSKSREGRVKSRGELFPGRNRTESLSRNLQHFSPLDFRIAMGQ